jgi:3-hexulose-6-phosphate synthase
MPHIDVSAVAIKRRAPIVQIALDYLSVEEALSMARVGVEAGVDWLEAGTPLIISEGLSAIGELARAFPDYPVLADFKTMDSGGKNVHRTKAQGGRLMTVCAGAPDQTIQAAVDASHETRVSVVVDTIGLEHPAERARQCVERGVDLIYLHYGADQRAANATLDSTQWIEEVLTAVPVSTPVGAGCFGLDDAIQAAKRGIEVIVIGHPLISSANPLGDLRQLVEQVRCHYRPRST